jgi:intracellular septation protein A
VEEDSQTAEDGDKHKSDQRHLFNFTIMKKPLIQRMLGKELTLPQQVWSRLNLAWALFFILCGLANIYIAFWLPQNIWVNFKVFGLTALTAAAASALCQACVG